MRMDSSKEAHIQFVSNHNGSSPSDVIFATLPVPLSVALSSVVLTLVLPARYSQLKYSSRLTIHLLVESCTMILPVLLGFTYLSNETSMNSVYIVFAATSLMLLEPNKWIINVPTIKCLLDIQVPEKKPPFLTNYRSGVNLATAICILAVDFSIFPRRFAKTETYGISLMDVGVGSFIIINGLVGGSSRTLSLKTCKDIVILLLLGLIRLIAVKQSNYHEHVTEYGVHWNFFLTLAVVKTLSTIVQLKVPPAVLSIAVLFVYETALKLGLEEWILSDYPRNNFLTANREGIFSVLGYLALFYLAAQLGEYLKKPKSTLRDWLKQWCILIVISLLGWISLEISNRIFGMSSRRLVNVSFCIWMLTYNSIIMATCLLVDIFLLTFELRRQMFEPLTQSLHIFREPYLMRFINYNGLAFFLLSNLLTGLVNFTIDTINAHHITSIIILFTYSFLLSAIVAVMYAWKIRV